MGDDNEGDAFNLIELGQKVKDGFSRQGVQISGWLIGEKDFRLQNQSPRHSHTLLLSPGEFSWFMRETIFQTHKGKDRFCPMERLLFQKSLDEARHHRIFYGIELGQEMMELEHEANLAISEMGKLSFIHAVDVFSLMEDLA